MLPTVWEILKTIIKICHTPQIGSFYHADAFIFEKKVNINSSYLLSCGFYFEKPILTNWKASC